LNQILKRQPSPFNYCSKYPAVTITVFTTILEQNSSYAKQSNDDILDSIERDIVNKYMNNGDIVLCGDLNARSGSEPYFIQNDSYGDHVPVNEDYECDIVQEKRNSYDNKLEAGYFEQ
jgi:endonuclease/exonuclease/phosphatase family metal-dependent hydrolase